MINHFRTLLINMASERDATIPTTGEEYIDPMFVPIILTGKLKDAHSALLPSGTSRANRNFYGYALMCLAHAPDFEKYVTTFDKRVVYDVASSIYISADIARSTYPAFQIGTMYVALASAMFSPGTSVFDMNPDYKEDMSLFKDVWHGSPSYKDKVTAGMMAVVYAMEGVRVHGQA